MDLSAPSPTSGAAAADGSAATSAGGDEAGQQSATKRPRRSAAAPAAGGARSQQGAADGDGLLTVLATAAVAAGADAERSSRTRALGDRTLVSGSARNAARTNARRGAAAGGSIALRGAAAPRSARSRERGQQPSPGKRATDSSLPRGGRGGGGRARGQARSELHGRSHLRQDEYDDNEWPPDPDTLEEDAASKNQRRRAGFEHALYVLAPAEPTLRNLHEWRVVDESTAGAVQASRILTAWRKWGRIGPAPASGPASMPEVAASVDRLSLGVAENMMTGKSSPQIEDYWSFLEVFSLKYFDHVREAEKGMEEKAGMRRGISRPCSRQWTSRSR